MSKDRAKVLIQTIKKIPLFAGLGPSQIQAVLSLCVPKRYEAGQVLCKSGTMPDEMYILLSGELGVVTGDGTRVATLAPVTTVGEMGIVTRQERVATVEAVKTSNILILKKVSLDAMLKSDSAAELRIYRNIVEILADKIVSDNVRIRDHLLDQVRRESRVREFQRRVEIALDMLVAEGGGSRDELVAQIDEKLLSAPASRVLVVDDEAEVLQILRQMLRDYEVITAENGEEALQAVQDSPPDLVITDIRMPVMDGVELLPKLRERYPDVPVLALSGLVSYEDIEEHGFDGFVAKPMKLDEFRNVVEGALAAPEA